MNFLDNITDNIIPQSEHHIDNSSISPNATFVVKTLVKNGFEAYIVGGCVRDLILNKKPKDFDVTTNATPEEVVKIFNQRNALKEYQDVNLGKGVFRSRPIARVIGKRFKIAHVTFGSEIIEVATFRAADPQSFSVPESKPTAECTDSKLSGAAPATDNSKTAGEISLSAESILNNISSDAFSSHAKLKEKYIQATQNNPLSQFKSELMSISSAAKIKKDLDNDIDLFKKDLNYIEFADDSIDETFINEHPLFILKALWANALYRKPLSDKLNHMVISCRSALLKVDTVEILNALTYGFYYPIVRNIFFDVLNQFQIIELLFPSLHKALKNEKNLNHVVNFLNLYNLADNLKDDSSYSELTKQINLNNNNIIIFFAVLFWPMALTDLEEKLGKIEDFYEIFRLRKQFALENDKKNAQNIIDTLISRATDFNEKAEKFASKVQNGIADTQLSELLKSYTTCLKTLATGTKSKIKSYVPLVHSVNNLSLKTKETVYCTAFIIFTESLRKIGFPANLNMIISYIWTLQFLFIFKISEKAVLNKLLRGNISFLKQNRSAITGFLHYQSYYYPQIRAENYSKIYKIIFYDFSESEQKPVQNSNVVQTSPNSADRVSNQKGMLIRDNNYGTMIEDTTRRDFTINALYYDVISSEIHDFHNGIRDLKNQRLDIIGEPIVRYKEDPVRMLRAIRFSSKLDMKMTHRTSEPIKKNVHLIQSVSNARMYDEIGKMFLLGYGEKTMKQMREFNLFKYIFPTIDRLMNSGENNIYEKFINNFLKNADARVASGKTGNLSFMYSALLWPEVVVRFEESIGSFAMLEELNKIAFLKPENVTENSVRIYNCILENSHGIKSGKLHPIETYTVHDKKFTEKFISKAKSLYSKIQKIFMSVCEGVLGKQAAYTAMPWFSSVDTTQIWFIQFNCYMTNKPQLQSVIGLGRFKGALDFLEYRSQVNPDLVPLFKFWQKAYNQKIED